MRGGGSQRPHSRLSVAPHLQSRAYLGMSTLGDLIFKRPSRQFQYLHVLLDLSSHEKDRVSLCPSPASLALLASGLLLSRHHGVRC